MTDTGYVSFFETDCIYIEENDCISIIPKDKDDIKKIRQNFNKQRFFFYYTGTLGYNLAFIKRIQFEIDNKVKLYPYYTINQYHENSFVRFDMVGDVIDDFFKPSYYFYDKSQLVCMDSIDIIYNSIIADKWSINFEGNIIHVTLSFGDILRKGIASDLKLHAKLSVEFQETKDTQYIYRIYNLMVRFFEIVRYDTNYGNLQVDLFCKKQGEMFHNGQLYDFSLGQKDFHKANHEIEYKNYKSYIQQFLQFSADHLDYTLYHYPVNGIRYRGDHYTAIDYINIFSAFEAECHAKQEIYENINTSNIQNIKDIMVTQLDEYPKNILTKEELKFLENAKNRILQLGTQYGQVMKVMNAYQVLHKVLDKSIENIFYLKEFRLKGHLQEKELKKIANFLVKERGKIAHGGFSGAFSDVDAQKIRFLEIITYAQLLKRIGLKETDIERVIGAVFGCNYILFNENISKMKKK